MIGLWFIVFNATFTNNSVIYKMYIVGFSFIGGENRSTRKKQSTCPKVTDIMLLLSLNIYCCFIETICLQNINKCNRKLKEQSRIDYPEKLVTLGTQGTGRRHIKQKKTTQKTKKMSNTDKTCK